jgi:hypothetical protein
VTPEECHAKRNELNAMVRKAEKSGDEALGNWCRLMAANMLLMAEPKTRDRGSKAYEKNKTRFEQFIASRTRTVLCFPGDPDLELQPPADLILEYINAFQAVNTMNEPPDVSYAGGWFTFNSRGTQSRKYRPSEFFAMIERLKARAAGT